MADGFLITQFGNQSLVYTFPSVQDSYTSNFGSLVTRVSRMPGMDGGYDELGLAPGLGEIGNVRLTFKLVADTRAGMEILRDGVKAMAYWGTQRLFMRPSNPAMGTRYCNAKVSNISMPQQPNRHTDLVQTVNIDFSVPYPFWFGQGTEAPIWGAGKTWGASDAVWGGTSTTYTYPGGGGDYDIALTLTGSAPVLPRIFIDTDIFNVSNVVVRGPTNYSSQNRVIYSGLIGPNKQMIIDCRAKAVTIIDTNTGTIDDGYDNNFDFDTADWMKLYPGVNNIVVSGDLAFYIDFKYYEVYR